MTSSHTTIDAPGIGAVPLAFTDQGAGKVFLLLHGGGGPLTVARFADLIAEDPGARVITPVHPGFGGTERPEPLTTLRQLAEIYVGLLERLEVDDVTVIGNSIGGWIAAEMSIIDTPRISRVVLVDAVGIDDLERPPVDFFSLSFPEIAQLSYFDPEPFRIDPSGFSPEQQATLATNRAALAVYGGNPSTVDPTLRARLAGVTVPTLVVWGDSDRIVVPEYGRGFADAIPGAVFQILPETGHLPQLESPQRLLAAIRA